MSSSSLKSFTDGAYKELKYNGTDNVPTGTFMADLTKLLRKAGISTPILNAYDDIAEEAVMRFQRANDMDMTGILDSKTYNALINKAKNVPDIIESVTLDQTTGYQSSAIANPHFDSYFDTDEQKTFRRNHKDIKIAFGNNSVIKTIKDVFMRGETIEVDTSGNPIYEVYEFIARDAIESDEPTDAERYNGDTTKDTSGFSSSDIKYNYV